MEFTLLNPAVLAIAAAVLVVVIVAIIIVKRYRIARPDEAIIVTGRKGKQVTDEHGKTSVDLSGQKVVTGGGVFVLPFVQRSFDLQLRARKITLATRAQTKDGITVNVQAVAMVKVGGTEEMIRAAAQRFLSQQNEIEPYTEETLSGTLRSIVGKLTVIEMIRERDRLAAEVLDGAEDALTKQGLVVDTLQLKELDDAGGDYIANLGKPEAARVRQEAEIANTNAVRAAQEAQIAADRIILDKQQELQLRQAEVKATTDKAAAEAEAAKPIEAAVQQQRIVEQQQKAAIQEASLREQQLNASVKKVADAEAYRIRTEAAGQADAAVATADAERRARINRAEAVAEEGKAEAEAIKAKGEAAAAATHAQAEALKEQSQAVLAQRLIDVLPQMAAAIAQGIGNIGNYTVVSSDGAGTDSVNKDIAGGLTSTFEILKNTTGIDVAGLINSGAQGRALGQGIAEGRESVQDAVAPVVEEAQTATRARRAFEG
jgi:flotillin